ncbi:hypothetical protein [Streptomyces halstedii]|uniref:hypothetical protein n=1 Tax=Streptomyces halstedii TaxID=1944 RepID=UPI0019459EC6|nr:hypothetical protein [Streptomyces halstedii]
MEAAQEAEATRRAERGAVYDREFVDTWQDRANSAAHSGDDAHARFFELLSAEPWFAANIELRAARHKRRHVLDEAQRAQRAVQEVETVPEQRFYAIAILDAIESHAKKKAQEKAAEFAEELREIRTNLLDSKD